MNQRTYTGTIKGQSVRITSGDLRRFRNALLGHTDLTARMSELIWLDIYILNIHFGVSPLDIIAAIDDVENGSTVTGTKPPSQFKNLPLMGLWHKHFFSAHFMLTNINLALGNHGLEKIAAKVFDPAISPVFTKEAIRAFANRIARDPFDQRAAAQKLTGEWIIYLSHAGQNYYLACNTHDAGDQFIYDRIIQNCVHDFPDLEAWIRAQR
ncbi:MAG: hypothetical protein JSR78_10295 [Proteobacteria bacterium]|nr:hypothetical protein [Pseudomonadota bacterium]